MTELLTLNALFKGDVHRRLRLLSGLLAQSNYDIVCLQEVMYRSNLRFFDYPHVFASGACCSKVALSSCPAFRCGSAGFISSRSARRAARNG
ncbi:endonuclease/exonuclease/phosphatase family protein [Catelliglobosispora koreensis]|uniref:endonuclease/exonuclease/phosphatase family protein n=1 Tax=Catelliglobosispora koreensis TaxID=129052 RepID=UPI000376520D|nr:endonuclease/exonuclease/phosphatase family protein [Catelliglobosispora koreensis]